MKKERQKQAQCDHPHHAGWCKIFRVWLKLVTEYIVFCRKFTLLSQFCTFRQVIVLDSPETVLRQSRGSPETVQRQSRDSPKTVQTVQRQSGDSQETVRRQSIDINPNLKLWGQTYTGTSTHVEASLRDGLIKGLIGKHCTLVISRKPQPFCVQKSRTVKFLRRICQTLSSRD